MITADSITDLERSKFLEKLIAESRAKNGLLLSDFENEFLASYQAYSQYHRFFNAGHGGRRKVCDRLWLKHGVDLEMPFPLRGAEFQRAKVKIAEADHNGCNFVIYEDGRPLECNQPATKIRRNGFRYCDVHAEQVQRMLKRVGKIIELSNFQPKAKP